MVGRKLQGSGGRASVTCSFWCRAATWQASPRAACRAWATTWRMQASGDCCTWAAWISSSRALHTEADTSSGSTNRNTLWAGREGDGRLVRMTDCLPVGAAGVGAAPLELLISASLGGATMGAVGTVASESVHSFHTRGRLAHPVVAH